MNKRRNSEFYVYLFGEIHTDWRDEIKRGAAAGELDVVFTSAGMLG
ncbi:YtoQ family protein [Pseudomonas sp. YJ42]